METTDCMFCQRLEPGSEPAGGWVLRDNLASAAILPGAEISGWFVLQNNRHADGMAGLTEDEASALGLAWRKLAIAVREVTGEPRLYSYSIGENFPHFHMVLGPPPTQAPERGRTLLCQILNRDKLFLDTAGSMIMAAQIRQAIGR